MTDATDQPTNPASCNASSNTLPPLYAAWMDSFLTGPIPNETASTCNNCAMLPPVDATSDANGTYFNPKTKCCTYLPNLPNFLVGRILCDDEFTSGAGRQSIEERMRAGVAVTPLGLGDTAPQALIYSAGAAAGFGRSESLLCPHYVADGGGQCGVWRNRNSVCVTWFCKHLRGATGKAFWVALQQMLATTERELAAWCVSELDVGDQTLGALFPPLKASGKAALTADALDGKISKDQYLQLWGAWAGREAEFYRECARLVNALSWADVQRLCGPTLRIQARMAKVAHESLLSTKVPSRLKLNTLKIIKIQTKSIRLDTYSNLDPLDVPKALLKALPHFDGRPVDEILAEVAQDENLQLTTPLVRKLVDFAILSSPTVDIS